MCTKFEEFWHPEKLSLFEDKKKLKLKEAYSLLISEKADDLRKPFFFLRAKNERKKKPLGKKKEQKRLSGIRIMGRERNKGRTF